MRVPKTIKHTDNTYTAMFSMLLAVRNHNQKSDKKIKKVLCPGLGKSIIIRKCTKMKSLQELFLAVSLLKMAPK
jgi:hypothetical protein